MLTKPSSERAQAFPSECINSSYGLHWDGRTIEDLMSLEFEPGCWVRFKTHPGMGSDDRAAGRVLWYRPSVRSATRQQLYNRFGEAIETFLYLGDGVYPSDPGSSVRETRRWLRLLSPRDLKVWWHLPVGELVRIDWTVLDPNDR